MQVQATNLPHYDQNAIKVYIVNNANLAGTVIGGFATYPWLYGYRDVIVLDRDEILGGADPQILAHELGHLFGLYHTFGGFSLFAADDYVSDTDWNPNTATQNTACPGAVDYTDPAQNLMSYNVGCLNKAFTP